MKKVFAGFSCIFLFSLITQAQSIYSFEGLGSLNHQGMPTNVAMGEVGIGSPQTLYINTLNPANLVYNTLSTFEAGVEVDRRRFSGDDITGSDADGGLRFLGYSFPIKAGKWSSSFGILPFSSVSYNSFSQGDIEGAEDATQIIDNKGEGGLTNFFWAHGIAIKEKLLVGVKASYTFGSIDKESTIFITGTDVPVSTISFRDQESYSDINFLFGLAYRFQLKERTYLNLGLIYSPESKFNGTSELSLARLAGTGGEIESQEVSTTDIDQKLPQLIGLGISYQRPNNLMIGFDFEVQQWGNLSNESEEFNNYNKLALGVEWTPDFDNVNSYFKRAKYSFGINRVQVPYILNDQSLIDFGINFGASLPVSGFSSLNLAFKLGRLGETNNGLIRENYFKIVLGAAINDRWFIKRKYD